MPCSMMGPQAPSPAFLDLIFAESAAHLAGGALGAHSLTLLASGLAGLKRRPKGEWLDRFAAQVLARLGECR